MSVNKMRFFVLAMLVGGWLPAANADDRAAMSKSVQCIVVAKQSVARLQIEVEIDKQNASDVWDESFRQLYSFYDYNGDGKLDQTEASRLPSAFSVRQSLWSPLTPFAGSGPAWETLDVNRDGSASPEEVVMFYRRKGIGQVIVGLGEPAATDRLTRSLLEKIDGNQDALIDEEEWRKSATSLMALDGDGDELVGPGELVSAIAYPGASGATFVRPVSADRQSAAKNTFPLLLLSCDESDLDWVDVLLARFDANHDGRLERSELLLNSDRFTALDRDKNDSLSREELAAWRKSAADLIWKVRLGKCNDNQLPLEDGSTPNAISSGWLHGVVGSIRLDLRADEGQLPTTFTRAREHWEQSFLKADVDHDEFLTLEEASAPKAEELKQLLPSIDRNGDGRLDWKEFVLWCKLNEQIAKGQVLLTVLDHGCGLFELLDVNHDGSLSVRELRNAATTVRAAECVKNDRFDSALLPRQLVLSVSPGHPKSPLGTQLHQGPEWFLAMDRNGDGDVSQREFLNGKEVFQKLDRDGDGLLSAAEAVASP